MYGRTTHFKGDPERLHEMVEMLPEIKAKLAKIEGGVANFAMWNDDATGCAVAIYESEEAAMAGQAQLDAIWSSLAHLMVAPTEITVYSSVERMR